MANLFIRDELCTGCGLCVQSCPFDAIQRQKSDSLYITSACRLCKQCLDVCPQGAIILEETVHAVLDKAAWSDILVYIQLTPAGIHPVGLELIGKARELAAKLGQRVHCVVIGENLQPRVQALYGLGVSDIYLYDHPGYREFRADAYADAFADCVLALRPTIVLVGATPLGRSLAPRVATRFATGLTADCTFLDVRENTDLVQTRPAFGGNIMAQIVTPQTRPQFATVRYKVMDAASPVQQQGERLVSRHCLPGSRIRIQAAQAKPPVANISDADVLVAIGRGVKDNALSAELVARLAALLGAQIACSRPLVEAGRLSYTQQIGLSGRTVKPGLIVTLGISGAVQFTACMNAAECIVAINSDPAAPIFKVAHYGVVGDLYDVLPRLIRKLEQRQAPPSRDLSKGRVQS